MRAVVFVVVVVVVVVVAVVVVGRLIYQSPELQV